MTHFTVLVIGEDVEGKLAPYNEDLEVDEYERACYCIGHKARVKAYKQTQEDLFRKYPILNDIFERQQGKYEENKAKAELSNDEREKARFHFLGREPIRIDAYQNTLKGGENDHRRSQDLFINSSRG